MEIFDSAEWIPGLPVELGLECLTRLPHSAHRVASGVCRKWRELLHSPELYHHRRRLGHTCKVACLVQALPAEALPDGSKPGGAPSYAITVFDPVSGSWERLDHVPRFPSGLPLFCQLAGCEGKLVVMGGWDPQSYSRLSPSVLFKTTLKQNSSQRNLHQRNIFKNKTAIRRKHTDRVGRKGRKHRQGMRSYGLILPASGTDPSRFYASPRPAAVRTEYPMRVRFGPIRAAASSRTEETVDSMAAAATFYDLLGIPETGTLPEIKQAYKQLARKYHPDVSPPDRVEEYTRRFIRVQEAYETLSDPRQRALYDRDMSKGLHLAFSARKSYKFDEGFEDKSEWKSQWQSQLSELKRRSMHKSSSRGNMSWGARMRRQRDESSDEL